MVNWPSLVHITPRNMYCMNTPYDVTWSSSLVEGDAQLDWPNRQTCMECCHACAAYFFGGCQKHNSLPLGPIQPSSPLLKSYIDVLVLIEDFSMRGQPSWSGSGGGRPSPRPCRITWSTSSTPIRHTSTRGRSSSPKILLFTVRDIILIISQ